MKVNLLAPYGNHHTFLEVNHKTGGLAKNSENGGKVMNVLFVWSNKVS
jgi:hypothetical protein